VDAADRLAEYLGDADGFDLRADGVGGAVGGDDLLDVRLGDALAALVAENGVGESAKVFNLG
jgi:hypothetical protein